MRKSSLRRGGNAYSNPFKIHYIVKHLEYNKHRWHSYKFQPVHLHGDMCSACQVSKKNLNKTNVPELFDDTMKHDDFVAPLMFMQTLLIKKYEYIDSNTDFLLNDSVQDILRAIVFIHKSAKPFKLKQGKWMCPCPSFINNKYHCECKLASI